MASSVLSLTLNEDNVENQNNIQNQQQQQQQTPVRIFIGKKIGSGKTSDVFECAINNQYYALKQYKQNHLKFLKKEVQALQNLQHPNIVEFIGQANETGLMLEYLPNGEVFDYIQAAAENFPSQLARFYGMQLSHAVAYMHQNNFAHLDLKLENCLFDDEFNLKLADFGFAVNVQKGQKETKYIGTHRYMSPEIEKSIPYDAKKADIFALGCVLFIFELGFQPIHTKAADNDKYYQYFAFNALDTFWKWLEKQYQKQFNPDFKDLIGHMMCKDTNKRYTIEQVLNHKYFSGHIYDRQSRVNYMTYLKKSIQN